jgi:hypothetical protein
MIPRVRAITEVCGNQIKPSQSSGYVMQVGTSGAGVPPGEPITVLTDPSSVAMQKFRVPVPLNRIGAALETNWVLVGAPPGANPAAKKRYPDLTPLVTTLSTTQAPAGLGLQPTAGPPKLFRSGANPMFE